MGERGDVRSTITDLIAAMPKVELHVHLEGCLTPELALHFARKNNISYPLCLARTRPRWNEIF
jgi:adenosine deaminase